MKRVRVICIFALVLAVSLISASPNYVLKVKVQTANVRSEPDVNAAIVKTLKVGTLLESSSKIGGWYEIVVEDENGNKTSAFINTSVVDVVNGEADPGEPAPTADPVAQQPAAYAAPKSFLSGGVRLLGGLASANVTFSKDTFAGEDPNALDPYQKARMGLLGGIGFETGGRLGFEVDLMYIQKGVKFAGNLADQGVAGGGDASATLSLDQASVPVLLKFKFLPGSTPYVFGGGELSYVLSSKASYEATINGQTEKGEQDLLKANSQGETSLNRFNYGVVVGVGYEMRVAGMGLGVEGRYYLGLSNIFKNTASTGSSSGWIHANALVVLGAIKF